MSAARYTAEEDSVIINCIKDNPANLEHAYKKASSLLENRTPAAICYRWQNTLKKRSDVNAISVVSRAGCTKNSKHVNRIDGIMPEVNLKSHLFLLHQVLELPREQRELIRNVLNS